MRSKHLVLRGVILVGIAVFLPLWVGIALANHLGSVYTGMDPERQLPTKKSNGNRLPENFISERWALGRDGDEIRWYDSSDGKVLTPLIRVAVANWESPWERTHGSSRRMDTGGSELGWREVDDSLEADMVIGYGDCTIGYRGVLRNSSL